MVGFILIFLKLWLVKKKDCCDFMLVLESTRFWVLKMAFENDFGYFGRRNQLVWTGNLLTLSWSLSYKFSWHNHLEDLLVNSWNFMYSVIWSNTRKTDRYLKNNDLLMPKDLPLILNWISAKWVGLNCGNYCCCYYF